MPQEKDSGNVRAPVRESQEMSDKELDELLKHQRGGRPCDGCDD